jgi:hypothetical protein
LARRKRQDECASAIIKADRIEEILNFGPPRGLNFMVTALEGKARLEMPVAGGSRGGQLG